MITKEIAMTVRKGAILHHTRDKGSDGQPVRCRVNGECKTWKTRPKEFRLPVKHGLNRCFNITEWNCEDWEVAA